MSVQRRVSATLLARQAASASRPRALCRKARFCGGQRFDPGLELVVSRGVDQDERRAHRGEIALHLVDAAIGRDGVVDRNSRLGILLSERSRLTHLAKHAVACRSVGGDLGERRLGFLVLTLLAEQCRGVERGAGFGGLLGFVPLITAPAADRGDEQHRQRNDQDAVAIPQLLDLLATQFLINFIENIGHEASPAPAATAALG